MHGKFFIMTQRRIYQKEYPYFVTWRVQDGYQLFEEVKIAELLAQVIMKTCTIKRYNILALQIMPDHIHLLIHDRARAAVPALPDVKQSAPTAECAQDDEFTISELMHGIKSFFCDQVRDQYGINFPFWQKRFYIRIVNTGTYINTVIDYIRHNPAKVKLSLRYYKYPYQYINLREIYLLF